MKAEVLIPSNSTVLKLLKLIYHLVEKNEMIKNHIEEVLKMVKTGKTIIPQINNKHINPYKVLLSSLSEQKQGLMQNLLTGEWRVK